MAFKRIEDADLTNKGVVGQENTPNLSALEMQKKVEEIPRKVIIPIFNALVDALNKGTGADGITVTVPSGVPAETANNLNAVLAALGAELLKRVISDDVKKIRLNSFGELEVSTDGSKFTVASSLGHVIEDGLDNTYTQRRKLRFKFTQVEDDPDSDATVVYGLPGPEGPPGPGGVVTDLDPGLFALTVDEDGNVTDEWHASAKQYFGQTEPKFRGNINSLLQWKDLSLNLNFGFQWGSQQYNETLLNKVEVTNDEIELNVDSRVWTERWQKPGDLKPYKGYGDYETKTSSRFVMDESVFELQSASLQYRWHTPFVKGLGLETVNFDVNMSDLFYISSIKRERGTDYPFARRMEFSVSFMF